MLLELKNIKESIRKEIVSKGVDKLMNELGLERDEETDNLKLKSTIGKKQFMKKSIVSSLNQ